MTRRLPTTRADWRRVASAMGEILRRPQSLLLALSVGVIALAAFSLAQQWKFVLDVLRLPGLAPRARAVVLLDRFPVVGSAYEPLRGWLLVAVSVETGVLVALLDRAMRQARLAPNQGAAGTAGVAFGALGAGCAACGTTLLAGVLSAFGLSSVLVLLPWEGVELLVLGVLGMLVSIHHVSASLARPSSGLDRGCGLAGGGGTRER